MTWKAFVEGLKARGIEPHVAINGTVVSKNGVVRKTAVPSAKSHRAWATRSAKRLRKRIEEGFSVGAKTVAGLHAGESARPRQGPRRLRLRHSRLRYRPVLPKLLAPTGEMGPAA